MANRYSEEFKEEAVRLVIEERMLPAQVSRDLGISSTSINRWVKQVQIDQGKKGGMTTSEREEIRQLRKEVRTLKMEREILKKAAAFFAKEIL